MNREVAYRVLDGYRALVERAQTQPWPSKDRRTSVRTINASLPSVNMCLHELLPDVAPVSGNFLNDHVRALPRVQRALAILKTWGEMTPSSDGEEPPAPPFLHFAAMDPLIGYPAMALWKAGKFRQAVNDAATRLNAFTQKRLDRHDVSDKELMAQAFDDKPPQPGKPRLRCPGDHRTMSVRSMQHGAMLMAMGVFQAIRNPSAHLTGDWNPVTAAEQLGALSVVARWVRHWDVVYYAPPGPDLSALSDPAVAEAVAKVLMPKSTQPTVPRRI